MSAEDILDLWLGAQHIGELRCVRDDDKISVGFDADYLANPARRTLGQAYLSPKSKPEDIRSTKSLPHWFGHLLPAGRLRRLLAQRARVHPEREFYLLGALGNDLVGALRVAPRTDLVEAAPLPPDLAPIPNAQPLRFSLAGMMLKFSSVETEKGMTIPASGEGGRFIIKLPGAFPGLAENEDVVMTWAAAAGINVPSHRTIEVSEIEGLPAELEERGGSALVVERFDRPRTGGRIHQEDFAQVFSKAHHEIRNSHLSSPTTSKEPSASCVKPQRKHAKRGVRCPTRIDCQRRFACSSKRTNGRSSCPRELSNLISSQKPRISSRA